MSIAASHAPTRPLGMRSRRGPGLVCNRAARSPAVHSPVVRSRLVRFGWSSGPGGPGLVVVQPWAMGDPSGSVRVRHHCAAVGSGEGGGEVAGGGGVQGPVPGHFAGLAGPGRGRWPGARSGSRCPSARRGTARHRRPGCPARSPGPPGRRARRRPGPPGPSGSPGPSGLGPRGPSGSRVRLAHRGPVAGLVVRVVGAGGCGQQGVQGLAGEAGEVDPGPQVLQAPVRPRRFQRRRVRGQLLVRGQHLGAGGRSRPASAAVPATSDQVSTRASFCARSRRLRAAAGS